VTKSVQASQTPLSTCMERARTALVAKWNIGSQLLAVYVGHGAMCKGRQRGSKKTRRTYRGSPANPGLITATRF